MKRTLFCLLLGAVAGAAHAADRHYNADQLPAPREVTPQELWRIGGFDDDFLLGVISAATVDSDGNVYLLDTQLSEVQVFDPEGDHLRTIGREGEGPGEFRRAGGLFWVDGNLCVVQRFPARLILFTPEGDPAGDLTVEGVQGMGGIQVAQVQGKHRVFAKASGRRADNGFVMVQNLASYDAEGNEMVEYESAEFQINMEAGSFREGDMVGFENNWVLMPDGTVVLGRDLDHYRLEFRAPDGSALGVTTIEHTLLARTDEEKAEMQGGPRFMMRGRGRNGGPEFIPRDNHPAFAELKLGPDGNLWALSSRGARPNSKGVMAQYDVFGSDGQLVERVAMHLDGSTKKDAVFLAPGHVILIRGYRDAMQAFFASFGGGSDDEEEDDGLEPEPLEVVVYRM